MDSPPRALSFRSSLDCRYLLHVPRSATSPPLVVVALHGYGSNPAVMLRLTALMVGADKVIAALQAPNQHYLKSGSPDSEIGYNWGTREHWAECVRLHHEMLLGLLSELQSRFGATPARALLVGFSQPVGLNYRFAGTHPGAFGGIVGICGGVPKDWEEDKYRAFDTPVLHIARDQDEFFPADVARTFESRLRKHASNVEFHLLAGAHRFPSKAGGIFQSWLARNL